jgi:hypothetical protein
VNYTDTIADLIETGQWEDGKLPTWRDQPTSGRADLHLACARHGVLYHPAEWCHRCEAADERQWMAQQARQNGGGQP